MDRSDLNKKIYGTTEAWRNPSIEGEHPYVYLDGIVLKRTWAGEVRNVGITGDSRRLRGSRGGQGGLERIPQASQGARSKRGPAEHLGRLFGACRECRRVPPRGCWQRYILHWYRNIFSHVPSTKVREIAAMLKAIHAGRTSWEHARRLSE
jgi:putative transposase